MSDRIAALKDELHIASLKLAEARYAGERQRIARAESAHAAAAKALADAEASPTPTPAPVVKAKPEPEIEPELAPPPAPAMPAAKLAEPEPEPVELPPEDPEPDVEVLITEETQQAIVDAMSAANERRKKIDDDWCFGRGFGYASWRSRNT